MWDQGKASTFAAMGRSEVLQCTSSKYKQISKIASIRSSYKFRDYFKVFINVTGKYPNSKDCIQISRICLCMQLSLNSEQ